MTNRRVVPNEASAVQTFASDFMERYGLPPFAGGENPGGGAPAATPPAPAAPAAEPAAPAAAAPAAVAPGGEPAAPGAAAPAAAQDPPDWGQRLLDGMERLAPPAQVDPLAVELGLVPPPAQSPAAPQGYDPAQMGPAAGLPQGALQQPQAVQPGQVPVVPGQQPQPGSPQAEMEAVNRLIEDKAQQVSERMIQERVMPRFQENRVADKRREMQALIDDYPELRDQAKQEALIARARTWATETLGNPAAAGEPGYLETTHLAMKGLEAAEAAKAAAAGNPVPGEVPIEGGGPGGAGAVPQTSEQRAQAIVEAKPGGGLSDVWI